MLDTIAAALAATGIPFKEAAWENRPTGDYGVYTLDGSADSVWADGHMRSMALEGTVDLFTRTGGQEKLMTVCTALNGVDGLSWYLSSIQYEQDTRLMHAEWVISYVVAMEA